MSSLKNSKQSVVIFLCSLFLMTSAIPSFADEYEVVPHRERSRSDYGFRGDLWFSDGAGYLGNSDGKSTATNRFRLGIDGNFGANYQFIIGWTAFDYLSSGESSPSVGNISRDAMDFDFGYFLIPDKFWLKGELHLEDVHGDDYHGFHGTLGYGALMGWRVYDAENFNLNLELSYLYVQSASVQTYDYYYGTTSTASFPAANIVTLNFRMGFNVGGR